MNPTRIDTIARLFADRKRSRRQTFAAGAASASLPAAAQEASPDASPIAPDAEHGPEMLFVQSFQSGTILPVEGATGRYVVTLASGLGQTIYFSDRPDRIVGAAPTQQFLDGLGFSEGNPPNAALVVDSGSGETDLAVVELFAPLYDDATHTVTYEVAVLDAWEESTDLGFTHAPTDLSGFDAEFGAAHLFIDDCADGEIRCMRDTDRKIVGVIPNADHDGFCYSWGALQCLPCQPWIPVRYDAFTYWDQTCNDRFADACSGDCEAFGV